MSTLISSDKVLEFPNRKRVPGMSSGAKSQAPLDPLASDSRVNRVTTLDTPASSPALPKKKGEPEQVRLLNADQSPGQRLV